MAPVVNYQAKPAPHPATSAKPLSLNGNLLPIAGGILALLLIGAIAAALMGRRRRRREQELADAQTLAYEPFEDTAPAAEAEPAMAREEAAAAPVSAFAWGSPAEAPETARADEPMAEQDDRRPGETWVERAYRGPTPNNPSVSLKARLRRAAFFDKREREVAAGQAEPVDMGAGLPDAMTREQERELA